MHLLITCPSGFEKHAKRESGAILRKIDSKAHVEYTYFKGLLLAELEGQREDVLRVFAVTDTKFISKITPLEAELKSIDEVRPFFENSDVVGKRFAVRCERRGTHPFSSKEIEMDIGGMLKEKGGIVDLTEPEIMFLVQIIQDRYFAGVATPSDILTKTPAVDRKWAKGERPVSRAELKMREVMRRHPEIFDGSYVALDLGAAPGGWSKAMAKKIKKIIAVDPGALDEDVLKIENVVHLKKRAENLQLDEEVEVLTNDANILPMESATLSCEAAEAHLKSGGYLVHTVKFGIDPDTGGPVAKSLSHAVLEVIRKFQNKDFEILSKIRLKYNTKNETTIVAKYLGNEE